MTQRRAAPLAFIAPILLVIAVTFTMIGPSGCGPVNMPPGAVELQGAAHMKGYLAGATAWALRGEDARVYWSFSDDGTWRAWTLDAPPDLGARVGLVLPPGATLVRGTWDATTDTLSLRDITTEDGAKVTDGDVPLRWIDGKLRIGIAGTTFMRSSDAVPPATPGGAG